MSQTGESASAENVVPDPNAVDLGCLIACVGQSEVRWRFRDPFAPSLEVTATLEGQLQHFLRERAERTRNKQHTLDLQHLPALSSRQLGTMLTLSKVLHSWGGLHLTHVSDAVRNLLSLTRMERFYKF